MTIEAVFRLHPGVDVLYQDEVSKQIYFTRKTAACVAIHREEKTNKEPKKTSKCKI